MIMVSVSYLYIAVPETCSENHKLLSCERQKMIKCLKEDEIFQSFEGKNFLVEETSTKAKRVLRIQDFPKNKKKQDLIDLRNKVSVLNFHFVDHLFWFEVTNSYVFDLLEYYPGGSLTDMIYDHWDDYFQPADKLKMALFQISSTVNALHEMGYIHADINSHNLMYLDPQNPRLVNFDSYTHPGLDVRKGTVYYQEYEVLTAGEGKVEYKFATDVWALGILFYQIATKGEFPFVSNDLNEQIQLVKDAKYEIPKGVDQNVAKLIKVALNPYRSERISMSDFHKKVIRLLETKTVTCLQEEEYVDARMMFLPDELQSLSFLKGPVSKNSQEKDSS